MGFLDALSSKLIFFDGGFGTMLQARGLPPGESPVNWNISHSEDITAIHKQYLSAGSDVVSANTFSIFEADDPLPLISAAVENAKTAVDASGKQAFVALDLGSTGKLMSPAGDLTF
ncbi:MAG: homocysteine S-methyltransferase family protein, partial [Clostridiales bacterium]|nr:homocysteine S-methyltransferase family protein [Clostridiales bacterium]